MKEVHALKIFHKSVPRERIIDGPTQAPLDNVGEDVVGKHLVRLCRQLFCVEVIRLIRSINDCGLVHLALFNESSKSILVVLDELLLMALHGQACHTVVW